MRIVELQMSELNKNCYKGKNNCYYVVQAEQHQMVELWRRMVDLIGVQQLATVQIQESIYAPQHFFDTQTTLWRLEGGALQAGSSAS